MLFSAELHTVTSVEIRAIEALGFSFSGSSMPADDFINSFFPNFNLLVAVRTIDTLLSSTTASGISKEILLIEVPSPSLEIRYYSRDWNDKDTGLALVRTFTLENDKPVVDHEFFRLPRSYRRKGIARKVLTALFQQYVNMGAKKILIFAALEDGGYVWATQHFLAVNPAEVATILTRAQAGLSPAEFNLVKRIYDHYYAQHIGGQSFPMYAWAALPFMEPILRKSKWHGAVDLTNPKEFSNFVDNAIG